MPNDGTTGCSGSGTPAAEFGSEASRTVWRVALDALWYKDSAAVSFNDRASVQVATKLAQYGVNGCYSPSSCEALRLDTGCLVTSIHVDWLWNAFMLGPASTALTVPLSAAYSGTSTDAARQQLALDNAAGILSQQSITDYYAGSWIAIATLTLTGDLSSTLGTTARLHADYSTSTPPSSHHDGVSHLSLALVCDALVQGLMCRHVTVPINSGLINSAGPM